ncbi:RLA class II histocompatibility antigen, DP alpha-1 chain-like [Protopterus annectens]|uniref:RLA class II histocompatibility antigen, DP alpha-1 chain-like n=1 Tax=Protopterus annectens TaxID=7888 RepID=UPI001CF94C80|nr:RLA class II histocompatibility antigen, DP alpha-1 chain-like [Protopterus annectens]
MVVLLFILEIILFNFVSAITPPKGSQELGAVLLCKDQNQDIQAVGYGNGEYLGYFDFEKVKFTPFNEKHEPLVEEYKNTALMQFASLSDNACSYLSNLQMQQNKDVQEKQVEPRVALYPKLTAELGRPNTLICIANQFHPPLLNISWKKNEENIVEGIITSKYLSNDDFSFLMYSYLPVTVQAGDIYTCTVAHSSLAKPRTLIWEPEFYEDHRSATVFCALGLIIGVLGVASGIALILKLKRCQSPLYQQ